MTFENMNNYFDQFVDFLFKLHVFWLGSRDFMRIIIRVIYDP
jgi:hypothetical protein